ncbi:MAG: GNAT family N-acetyltransferase [Planctomycetia bacterium]|nr:GNAT family N-acetyltransferase [Planctomycetia bacterium]
MSVRDDVLRLITADYGRARSALTQAFYDYVLMTYAAPDGPRRAAGVLALYGAILCDCFRWGEVYVTSDVKGAACWLPPEKSTATLIRQIRSGMLLLPFRFGMTGFTRLLAYDAMARELHHEDAPGPHWYLAAIGVEPEHRGQGIGGALMQPILARADAQGLPCYLETHREANVRLYEKHGFKVTRKCDVPGHPIPVWAMLREPQRASS